MFELYLGPKTSPRGSASVSASVRRGRRNIMVCIFIYVVRVVQILALGGWREYIFLHTYIE